MHIRTSQNLTRNLAWESRGMKKCQNKLYVWTFIFYFSNKFKELIQSDPRGTGYVKKQMMTPLTYIDTDIIISTLDKIIPARF